MTKVKIFGAGSIGNHYAFACINKKWDVTIIDIDPKALERMRYQIYPSRYGRWNKNIRLISKDDNENYDIVMIGTPPTSHLNIATKELIKKNPPKVIHIEKPLCTPDLKGIKKILRIRKRAPKTQIFGGYNHSLTKNTIYAEKLIKKIKFGKVLSMQALNRENWIGIYKAHFWIKSMADTYLGYYQKGGGALCEHSHGLNIWSHFSNFLGLGKVKKVNCNMKIIEKGKVKYDETVFLNLTTNKNFLGNVYQDVITDPAQKILNIQFEKGYVNIINNFEDNYDAVKFSFHKKVKIVKFKKSRPDDFIGLINHLQQALKSKIEKKSPISLNRSIEIMKIINASFKSHKLKKTINI